MVTDEKPQILNCNIQFYFKSIEQTITFKLCFITQFKCNGLLCENCFEKVRDFEFQGHASMITHRNLMFESRSIFNIGLKTQIMKICYGVLGITDFPSGCE